MLRFATHSPLQVALPLTGIRLGLLIFGRDIIDCLPKYLLKIPTSLRLDDFQDTAYVWTVMRPNQDR